MFLLLETKDRSESPQAEPQRSEPAASGTERRAASNISATPLTIVVNSNNFSQSGACVCSWSSVESSSGCEPPVEKFGDIYGKGAGVPEQLSICSGLEPARHKP
jgi:hypothetical protein